LATTPKVHTKLFVCSGSSDILGDPPQEARTSGLHSLLLFRMLSRCMHQHESVTAPSDKGRSRYTHTKEFAMTTEIVCSQQRLYLLSENVSIESDHLSGF
jgi:hypothetical protein